MMVGREVLLRVDKTPSHPGEPLLSVESLTVIDDRGLETVHDVSLEVRAGEILGLAGVDGNGQSELIDAIAGLRHAESGRVILDGEDDLARDRTRRARQRHRAHPGGSSPPRPRPAVHAHREPRPPRLPVGAELASVASCSFGACSSGRGAC